MNKGPCYCKLSQVSQDSIRLLLNNLSLVIFYSDREMYRRNQRPGPDSMCSCVWLFWNNIQAIPMLNHYIFSPFANLSTFMDRMWKFYQYKWL